MKRRKFVTDTLSAGVFAASSSPLKVVNGKIKVPDGPGLGITFDPDFIRKHEEIK
jgi:L-alanine-DL-glutamate epimerase-like enolase superfamily enzyme